jgi:penicillin-binding protein 2
MRLSAIAIVVLSLVGALTARLWFLTAVEGEASVSAARANSIRTIHIQAPRGRIFDRNKQMLVDNRQVRQVRIDQRALDEAVAYEEDGRQEVYQRLADSLNLYEVPVQEKDVVRAAKDAAEADGASDAEVDAAGDAAVGTAANATWSAAIVLAALENNNAGPFVPTPVAEGVPESLEVLLAENQMQYPGVDVEPVAVRYYPHGTLAAHVLGYVKAVTPEELASETVDDSSKPYALGDEIGKTGVELSYEQYLRGTPGTRIIEVDAANNYVRTIRYDPPIPGDDVMLELDVQVQAMLELSLKEQAEAHQAPGASGMVMDPRDGSIIAMASYPTYDPVELSGRLSTDRYTELRDAPGAPLTNKVIAGQYPPGSTFKPVTAVAALRAGIVDPAFTYVDQGVYTVQGCEGPGCDFHNPDDNPLGPVNLAQSLTVSSDTYYYRLGDQLWGARETVGEDALQETAREFGFGTDTGVDLPTAIDGSLWTPEILSDLVAEHPENYVEGARWRTGDTVNMSIGQGYLAVTPLQLTNMYAAIANGGELHTPHVGRQVLRRHPDADEWSVVADVAPHDIGHVEMRTEWRDAIMQGLLGVPQQGPGGTAYQAFEGFDLAGFPIAGKTGTAQKTDELDYGLFVGMGPVVSGTTPQYIVSAVFEAGGEFGGTIAAPPVRRVFDGLRDRATLPMLENMYQATPIDATTRAEVPTDSTVPDTGVLPEVES